MHAGDPFWAAAASDSLDVDIENVPDPANRRDQRSAATMPEAPAQATDIHGDRSGRRKDAGVPPGQLHEPCRAQHCSRMVDERPQQRELQGRQQHHASSRRNQAAFERVEHPAREAQGAETGAGGLRAPFRFPYRHELRHQIFHGA